MPNFAQIGRQETLFGPDYFAARDAFRERASDACSSLELSARGPQGEPLTIDMAWLGAPDAQRVLLVSSGIHGVEGFSGSALQCNFLAASVPLASGCAVVLAHALNPWGFAYLRRVNENNVDLNRNFLAEGERYAGAPPEYQALDPFLNPRSLPRADGFYVRALARAARHGMGSLRQTITGGQYEFAQGLFFGGQRPEPGPQLYLRWLRERFARVERVLAVDLHTGLGRFGALTVYSEPTTTAARRAQLSQALGIPIVSAASLTDDNAYSIRGSMCAALPQVLPHAEVDALTAEFGTYSGVRIVCALRDENRWHHYGDGDLAHPAKRRLLEVFRPDSAAWREAVLRRGSELLQRSLHALMQS